MRPDGAREEAAVEGGPGRVCFAPLDDPTSPLTVRRAKCFCPV